MESELSAQKIDDCDSNTISSKIANTNSYYRLKFDSNCTENTISGNKIHWNDINRLKF